MVVTDLVGSTSGIGRGGGDPGLPSVRQAVQHRRLHIPVDTQLSELAPAALLDL